MKPSLTLPVAIVIGGIIVAGAVYATVAKSGPSTSSGDGNPALVRPVLPADHVFGNPAAPVKIIEYADFDCEYCKSFDETLRQLIAHEGATGKVAWVYRQFPLIELHQNAMRNAEASECAAVAGGNDGFWRFTELLFKNQPIDPAHYGLLATQANIPSYSFAECMSRASSTIQARIEADRENALAAGARGTPYSLIVVDGAPPVVVDGAYSYAQIKQLVDRALQTAEGTSSTIIKN